MEDLIFFRSQLFALALCEANLLIQSLLREFFEILSHFEKIGVVMKNHSLQVQPLHFSLS